MLNNYEFWTLTAIGALSPAACAIIGPIALGFAGRYGISPLMMGMMVVHGAQAGGFSPISVFGSIVNGVVENANLEENQMLLFVSSFIFNLLLSVVVFFLFGGRKLLGHRVDAAAVAATADATLLVTGRQIDGRASAGTFTGYKPYVEGWAPDVLWMEGTLQMRMAKAALGQDVSALDNSADRWAALTSPGMMIHASSDIVGNNAGDFHTWPAAAPAAWLTLSRSGSDVLR